MKPAAFGYVRAASVEDAIGHLVAGGGDAIALAGGQSLVPMMNLRLARPEILVDIGGLAELRAAAPDGDALRIGALVTHAAIEDGGVEDATGGFMKHVAGTIAYRAVRNAGTIGGSLAHADPAADWPAALLALGAEVELTGPRGARRVAIDDFLVGPFETARAADELLTAVIVPRHAAGTRWAYVKVNRKAGEFAEALGIAIREPERGLRVVVGATPTRPVLIDVKDAADGSVPSTERLREIVAAAAPGLAGHALARQAAAVGRAWGQVAADG